MDWGLILGIVGGLAAVWLLLLLVLFLLRPREAGLGDIMRLVPDVARLVRGLIADGRTPLDVRAALVGLLVWLVSPIDLIPDFIPVLGPIDDVVVAVLVLRYVRRRIGDPEMQHRWPGSAEGYRTLARLLGGST